MPNTYNYFVLAYLAIWGVLFAYQITLHGRINKLRKTLKDLNEAAK